MRQKHTLQWLQRCHRQGKRAGGAAGSGADRAERFQHRFCVCAAAHYQYGCGRGMGQLLGCVSCTGGHPAGTDHTERSRSIFE